MDDEDTPPPSQEELAEREEAHRAVVRDDIWSRDDTGHDLTVEEALFCRSYIIDREPVATFRRLGYTGSPERLKALAKKHLANPEVQGCIGSLAGRLMKKFEVSAESITKNLASMAFFDARTIMRFDGHSLRVLDSSLWSDEAVAAISGVKMTKDAGVEIKFVDKLKATETLGRQLNLLQDPDENMKKAMADSAAEEAMLKISNVFDRLIEHRQTLEDAARDNEALH